ncbi:MAG: sugar nucleotide-binding protein [Eubacteriales bacterium]|nr:sugar nucleotide-binding protein [Eubacteriales bacterium]
MKVLLTGATGFLGSRALPYLKERFAVDTVPSSLLRGELTAERAETLYRAVSESAPEVILHTAAISDTGYAQLHPDESFQANVALPEAMAKIAAKIGAKLVCCSSDQVYNGVDGMGPFAETDPVKPAGVYGRHKLEAEERVAQAAPGAVSLRLTWMYDLPVRGQPTHKNLLTNLLVAAARREPLHLSQNDYRGVTYAGRVVENFPLAFALEGGVYNYGSESDKSVWQIAGAWCGALGIDPGMLWPTEGKPRSLCMDCVKARAGGIVFEDSASGIGRLIREYGLDKL